jgi:hypothetical protein
MAWVLPALTAVSAVAGLGSAALNSGRTNNQAIQKSNYANAGLGEAQGNAQYMRMLSALINQRSIAGSVDEAGTSMRYDPATNQWVSELGKLPVRHRPHRIRLRSRATRLIYVRLRQRMHRLRSVLRVVRVTLTRHDAT